VRGSTSASRASPFTRIRTRIFSASDIFVSCLHLLSPCPARRDADGALHQRRNERPFVVGRAAHIALRFGGFARGFRSLLNRLVADRLSLKRGLRVFYANGHQAHATENHAGVLAGTSIIERHLRRGTHRGVDRGTSLERYVR